MSKSLESDKKRDFWNLPQSNPKSYFWGILLGLLWGNFQFFGVSGVLGGQDFLNIWLIFQEMPFFSKSLHF